MLLNRRTPSRRLVAIILLAGFFGMLMPYQAQAATDKTLTRVRGSVSYDTGGGVKPIEGQLVLPDQAVAITGMRALGRVGLPDSSTIDIGENVRVAIGAFSPAESGRVNVITLSNGALRFHVVHPAGARSNYTFVTPTSQIAVRGTDGYLVTGPHGTEFSCLDCAPGDVTITTQGESVPMVTGQTYIVTVERCVISNKLLTVNPQVNNDAFNQFNDGTNPFGDALPIFDPT
ncbi:MAG: FecR domain-containing protein, partial [Candidatus Eremiobacteraeota bacterium]|nr:FecR domain-containing protein [Candidatus Eremiobacteraeota bacterium]